MKIKVAIIAYFIAPPSKKGPGDLSYVRSPQSAGPKKGPGDLSDVRSPQSAGPKKGPGDLSVGPSIWREGGLSIRRIKE